MIYKGSSVCSQYDKVVKFNTPIEVSAIIGLILHAGGYQYSNCTEAGFFTSSSKFCLWKGKENGDANCYLPKGHCFCDEECCSLDDCCPDVDCSSSKLTSQLAKYISIMNYLTLV